MKNNIYSESKINVIDPSIIQVIQHGEYVLSEHVTFLKYLSIHFAQTYLFFIFFSNFHFVLFNHVWQMLELLLWQWIFFSKIPKPSSPMIFPFNFYFVLFNNIWHIYFFITKKVFNNSPTFFYKIYQHIWHTLELLLLNILIILISAPNMGLFFILIFFPTFPNHSRQWYCFLIFIIQFQFRNYYYHKAKYVGKSTK